jgi:hypothetical protein
VIADRVLYRKRDYERRKRECNGGIPGGPGLRVEVDGRSSVVGLGEDETEDE